jgi:hypothetical protein
MDMVVRLAEESQSEGGLPPIWWGIGAFSVLVLFLVITLAFGKGRPHA